MILTICFLFILFIFNIELIMTEDTNGLKNGTTKEFPKKKFLFISYDALISDIAWQVTKEGHEAKYYIKEKEYRDSADGLVEKTDDWEKEVEWADIIVFDDVLGQGTMAQKLREKGKLVVGGTPYTDRLEDERGF